MTISYQQPCDLGVVRSGAETQPGARSTGRWVLAATIIGSSMAFIDGTVVNVALPVLQRELGATVAGVQWVVEVYALMLAALMVVGGVLGDRFGRRRIFAVGVAVFAAASVWCGLAPSVAQLVAGRALQGVGGALLVPGSLALIAANFATGQRGRAIGLWSGLTAITAAVGPVLGGWLVENLSWRWVFYINVPLALVVLLILYARVPERPRAEGDTRLDWPGALLATLGLGALVYGLIESVNFGLAHPVILAAVAGGVLALAAFVYVERHSPAPMVPLFLFRSRTFSGANLITLLLYAALGGSLFYFPFNLIQVQGYSATAAGAAFLPLIVILFLLSRWSGGLVDRFGAKGPLIVGPLMAAVGFALFAVPGIGGTYWSTFFPAMAVLGLGMAISVAPLTTVVMNAVEEQFAGLASGINNAVSRVAGLIAVALLGVFVLVVFNAGLDTRLAVLDVEPAVQEALAAERIKLAGAQVPAGIDGELRAALERAIAESFVAGFRLIMLIGAGLALCSAVAAALMIQGQRAPAGGD